MPTIISTDEVPERARIHFWRQSLTDLFGARHEIQVLPGQPFTGTLTWRHSGPVALVDCHGSACKVVREAGGTTGKVMVVAQVEGSCTLRQGEAEIVLADSSLCVLPLEARTEYEFAGSFRQLTLIFDADVLAQRQADWPTKTGLRIDAKVGAGGVFLSLLQATLQHQQALADKCCHDVFLALLGLLVAALGELGQELRPISRMASYHKGRVRNFVLGQLSNPHLDIPMIASHLGISTRYIFHLFSAEDMHLMRWIWAERLERCRLELTQRAMHGQSISAIAYSWGFNDPAHFSRAFRKHFGITAREMRRLTIVSDPALDASHKRTSRKLFSYRQDAH